MKKFRNLLIILLFPVLLAAEVEDKEKFKISDIFTYKHPDKKGADEKKNYFNLFAGYERKTGNTDSSTINYSTSYRYFDNILEFKIRASGTYGETSGEETENNGNVGANLDYYLIRHLELFTFSFSEYDRIVNLEHRNSTGLGAKLVFLRNRYTVLDLSGAPLSQYEKYSDPDQSDTEWRWSVRGRILIMPDNPRFQFRYVIFYTPLIEDNDIYRIRQFLTMDINIMEHLTFRINYSYDYNTYNEEILNENPDIKKTNQSLKLQLGVKI